MIEVNKIYNMECLEGMKNIDDSSIDLIMTDPPYYIEKLKEDQKENTLRSSSKNNIFHAEWDHFKDIDEYKYFILKILKEFKRILKQKGQVYMFFSYHHIHWLRYMIEKERFVFYKFLIWYKPDTMGIFPNQYGCNYENIVWFRNNLKGGEVILNISNFQRDVFTHNSTNIKYREECGFHPTPKPIQLVRRLILNATNENALVLDPFMGSGTTAVACKQTKRNFVGFELSKEYCDICNKRLQQEILTNTLHDFYKTEGENNELL